MSICCTVPKKRSTLPRPRGAPGKEKIKANQSVLLVLAHPALDGAERKLVQASYFGLRHALFKCWSQESETLHCPYSLRFCESSKRWWWIALA